MRQSQTVLKMISLLSYYGGRRTLVAVKSCYSQSRSTYRTANTEEAVISAHDIVKEHNIPIERVSLSRGLALNRFEKDFFIYPEYSDTDAAEYALHLASALKEDIKTAKGQDEILSSLWDKYSLASFTVPKRYGGADLCYKDLLNICEALGSNWNMFARFEQTYLAASLILQFGNDYQKSFYLPQIGSGVMRPAICFSGSHLMNFSFESVTASCENFNGVLKLAATKQYAINASDADLLLVFAKQNGNKLAYCLVEPGRGILEATTEISLFGKSGLEVNSLRFREVIVKPTSILSSLKNGTELVQNVFLGKLLFGTAVVGMMKALINFLSEYCNTTLYENSRLADWDPIKHLITKLALDTYVLESMCYYIGGLYDEELILLIDVEEALIYKYARSLLSKAISSVISIMDMDAVFSGVHFNSILTNLSVALFLSKGELEFDSFIASKVITSYANDRANRLNAGEIIPGRRNFRQWLFFDGRLYDRIFGRTEKAISFYDPKLKHFMAEHAHPSLKEACINVEQTMCRLESLLDLLLSKHGKDLLSDYNVLGAISKVIECNLGMITTIARSSRSYSIGLRNGDLEVSWTHLYCSEAANRSIAELRRIYEYFQHERLNSLHLKIGQTVLDGGGYCIESPVTRNW